MEIHVYINGTSHLDQTILDTADMRRSRSERNRRTGQSFLRQARDCPSGIAILFGDGTTPPFREYTLERGCFTFQGSLCALNL